MKRALLMISKTQLVAKGVDGAAFQISSRSGRGFAARSNVTAELEKLHGVFTSGDASASSRSDSSTNRSATALHRPGVGAAKLVHKARTVQTALRAAELSELAADAHAALREADLVGSADPLGAGGDWADAAEAAGVTLLCPPLRLPVAETEAGADAGTGICALVLRDGPGRGGASVTVALCDDLSGEDLVKALARAPTRALCRVAPRPKTGHGGNAPRLGGPVAAAVLDAAVGLAAKLRPTLARLAAHGGGAELAVQCVGHSFAGAVAAVLAALLDGTLVLPAEVGGGEEESGGEGGGELAPSLSCGAVTCLALGPCPCVGPGVALPGATSVVLGDDLVARLQPRSIARLRARVGQLLPGGLGRGTGRSAGGVGLAARLGGAWLGDAVGSALRNAKQRPGLDSRAVGRQAIAEAGTEAKTVAGGEGGGSSAAGEAALLACPGVVYLLKPRASGAVGVTTLKRGGLSEALLWQMHEALISKSMLAHHRVDAYIGALDAV